MTTKVSINGVLHDPEEARVSVFDRGFLYGDGVFEVLRTYGGVPFALDEHLARLEESARLVAMDLPAPLEQFGRELQAALRAAGNAESYARVMVTRGTGELGLDPALAHDPLRVVIIQPLKLPPREVYRDGVSVITVATARPGEASSGAGAKSTNYLANLLALREAKSRGAHEAFLVTSTGTVLEGSSSNVFVVRGGAILTPPLEVGVLAGITRRHVLSSALAARVQARTTGLTLDDLYRADEVFLTSTLRELVPVVKVDDRVIGMGAPGAVTRAVHRAFRSHTPAAGLPMPWE